MKIQEMFLESGLVSSKNEFKRLVKQNGARVNDMKLADPDAEIYVLENEDLFILVEHGQARFFDFKWNELQLQ